MKDLRSLNVVLVILAALVTRDAHAQQTSLAELRGGRDHPTVTRFAGSTLVAQGQVPLQKVTVALSALVMTPVGPNETAPRAAKKLDVEGRVSRHLYVAPPETSILEVHRNYEDALKRAGFKAEFSCAANECGVAAHGRDYIRDPSLDPNERRWFPFDVFRATYIAARKDTGGAAIWALVMVDEFTQQGHSANGRAGILQVIIEERAANLGQVQIDAQSIGKALVQTGKAALYGLYFDTDSDVLKPQSQPQLIEVGKYLTANPKDTVLIVGHTDNVGALDYNLTLSQRRADAVVRALKEQFSIPGNRLVPRGVGMAAPIGSNASEGGRALNRRVEIVLR
jgi:outer membrane protein OmpA-like peptidoglycan-associated protein